MDTSLPASSLRAPNDMTQDIRRVIFSEEELQKRVRELAGQISATTGVSIHCSWACCKGVVFFMTDLCGPSPSRQASTSWPSHAMTRSRRAKARSA